MEADVPLIFARWIHFASLMLVFGASLFRLYGVPRSQMGAASMTHPRTDRMGTLAAVVALASALAWVGSTLTGIAGDIGGLINPQTLADFFLETSFGPVWLLRLGLLVVIALLAALPRVPAGRLRWVILTGLAATTLGSQAWLGHAAIGRGAKLITELTSYIVHVIAAGAWIGGLMPLGEMLAAREPISRATEMDQVAALFRFSNVGMAFVSLVFVSGVANTVFRLASIRDLATTAYGWTVLLKAIIFSSMVAVAVVNRFVLMPNIEGGGSPWIAAIRRNIVIEQLLAALVLGAAAILGILPPHG